MRLTDAERKQIKHVAKHMAPVIHDPNAPDWLPRDLAAFAELDVTVRRFGTRGKHLNSVGWRIARRFGWRAVAVA